jgi:hypothetical protein
LAISDAAERRRYKKSGDNLSPLFFVLFAGKIESIAEMKSMSRRGFSIIGRDDVLKDKIRFEPPTDTVI